MPALPAESGKIGFVPTRNGDARRHLDKRFERLRPLLTEPRPHRGWVRAMRDALGMSGAELAARMGVAQSTVADLESSEMNGTIKSGTLRRAADALDCELVYFLVPRTSLQDLVTAQSRRKAAQHLTGVAHHSRLEDQELDSDAASEELKAFAADLVDRRGLWSDRRT
jgi:predicted DNA-binding mobile mystery protein A